MTNERPDVLQAARAACFEHEGRNVYLVDDVRAALESAGLMLFCGHCSASRQRWVFHVSQAAAVCERCGLPYPMFVTCSRCAAKGK